MISRTEGRSAEGRAGFTAAGTAGYRGEEKKGQPSRGTNPAGINPGRPSVVSSVGALLCRLGLHKLVRGAACRVQCEREGCLWEEAL